jgi:S-adenosylmethionine:tRNA ribosyltransferase-isomerase
MRVLDLEYELPPELIAQEPPADREQARLLVVPQTGELVHAHVSDLVEHIPANALVVLNDTKVLPARLFAQKESGGRVEIFLLRKTESRREDDREVEIWRALGKASKALRFGVELKVRGREGQPKDGHLFARILARAEDDGTLEVALYTDGRHSIEDAIRSHGHMPLPPYIKRDVTAEDEERYQTVYARSPGAVAAPTAGLHFTRALLGRLAVRGCEVTHVTLHVGLGTFQPVVVEDLDQHKMHAEYFEVSSTTARAVTKAKQENRPIVAVGTTAVRALEAASQSGAISACAGETRLLIQPGYQFRVVDMMLTNFHLPKTTLLALVCAFAGRERVMHAYREAVAHKYRFFSYGDAMLLSRAEPTSQ